MTDLYPHSKYVPAKSAKEQRYRRDSLRSRGGSPWVPAGPVVDRLDLMRGMGLTYRHIARLAGVSDKTLRLIHLGERRNVQARVAEAVMRVDPRGTPPVGLLPIDGVIRRVQALQAIGWRFSDIGSDAGLPPTLARQLKNQNWIGIEQRQRVLDCYARLAGTQGPSRLTEQRARKRGWPTPMDWESVDIDDPMQFPEAVKPVSARTDGERRDDLVRLVRERGMTVLRAAEVVGVSDRTANRWLLKAQEAS